MAPKSHHPKPESHHRAPLRKGASGPAVTDLQNQLVSQGFKFTPNGHFGPQTERFLRDFQRKQGIPAHGVADARTLQELAHPGLAHQNAIETISHLKVSPSDISAAMAKRDTSHSKPPSQLSASSQMIEHLFHAEGGDTKKARGLYWPGGNSGVTAGPGYDMKLRTKKQIHDDMVAAHVPDDVAWKVAEGSKLTNIPRPGDGMTAEKFAHANAKLLDLDIPHQKELLHRKLGDYEADVRHSVHVDLLPNEFDALVSFTYNAGGGAMHQVGQDINQGDVIGALQKMETFLVKGSDYKNDPTRVALARRRNDEVRTYLFGHP